MSTVMVPASAAEALGMLEAAVGFLAGADAAQMPAGALAECLQVLERTDAVGAVARGQFLQAFDAQDGHLADGQRTTRTWLVHTLRVPRGQAAEHRAVQALAREHPVLLAGLRGQAVTKSVTLQLAKWTRVIPDEFRARAEEILIAAARAGADLRALAAICAEIRCRTAPPDPDGQDDGHLDRALSLETTFEGAGVIRGDLTPECAAMVRAVLDALSAPRGGGDLRTRPQRYHDALEEAMRRLLASDLLPARAGQPARALVHIHFTELCQLDAGSAVQDTWIAGYRARWAAHRAAASVATGDGGAWLEGDAARAVACDAMIIPVVTADLDPAAVEDLIGLCVHYDRIRSRAPAPADGTGTGAGGPDGQAGTESGAGTSAQDSPGAAGGAVIPPGQAVTSAGDSTIIPAAPGGSAGGAGQDAAAGRADQVLAMLKHQILAKVLQVVSGPGGVASFLRRNLLGQGLNGPSLPLDVGQP